MAPFLASYPLLLRSAKETRFFASGALALVGALGCGVESETELRKGAPEANPSTGGSAIDDIEVEDLDDVYRGDCERTVRLETLAVTKPAPFDVVIVADHSESLSWSREDLARGLSSLLARVRGHDARFYLLTPTQYGASSAASRSLLNGHERVIWQDPDTLLPFEHAVTQYEEYCIDAEGRSVACEEEFCHASDGTIVGCSEPKVDYDLTEYGAWKFELPPPLATLTPEMTDAEISTQQQTIAEGILGLGTLGSSDEQPVCTLLRYMGQERARMPDKAHFLVISDEDDTSLPERCLAGQETKIYAHFVGRVFEMKGKRNQEVRDFECAATDDLGNIVGTPTPWRWNLLNDCTSDRACTPQEEQDSRDECPADQVMQNCHISCKLSSLSCRVEETLAGASVDACTQSFSKNSRTWENMLDYCSTNFPTATFQDECENYELEAKRLQEYTPLPVSSATSVTGMVRQFRENADEVFGPTGYSVGLIGFHDGASCLPQTGQSHLHDLKGLVSSDDHVFSICEDYSGALGQLESFADSLLQPSYQLALAEGETLNRVGIVGNDGSLRALAPTDYSFDATTGTLDLREGVLFPNDQGLDLGVLTACVVR